MKKMSCKPATLDSTTEKKSGASKSKASAKPKNASPSYEEPIIDEPSSGIGMLVALEPRILFDGAALATGAEVLQDTPSTDQTVIPGVEGDTSPDSTDGQKSDEALWSSGLSLSPPSDRKEIVFIDTSVDDFQTLMEGIDPNAEVILLDSTRDGVEQIAEILGERTDIDAVHIISHGDSGELRLGTGVLNFESMEGEYTDELATINRSLTDTADFLIYGCNFGEGDGGREASSLLAELTGADIAASNDLTGAESTGGDWDLEVQIGKIESSVIVSEQAQEEFSGVLDITTGLVADFTFDADATDASGNNYDGTLTGDAAIDTADVTDIVGEGKLSLDGTGDYVNLDSHIAGLNGLTEGTIAGWVRVTDTGENILVGLSDKDDSLSLAKFGIEAGGQVKWLIGEGGGIDVLAYSTQTVNDGAWHHLAITVNSSGTTMYIDGAVEAVTYSNGSASSTNFFSTINDIDAMDIGRSMREGAAEAEFNGLADEVRIYNRVLTSGEIAELASTTNIPTITNLGGDTLAYTEGDGAQVIDQGANAAVTDVDSSDFDTGTLTVSFTAGSDSAEDALAIQNQGTGAGQIGVSGSNVTYAGTTIGTFTGGTSGADLVISLNANADATTVGALVQHITYENTDTDNPTAGSRTVRYVLTDGDGGTSANYDTTVTVTAVNDAPTFFSEASFTAGTIINTVDRVQSMITADVDGDGDLDIVATSIAADDSGSLTWFENIDGQGTFGVEQVITNLAVEEEGITGTITVADVDGDGDLDVVASDSDTTVAWYENTDGLGTFGAQQAITTTATGANTVIAADVDGDGNLDVVVSSASDNTVAWYENTDGLGTFGAEQIITDTVFGASLAAVADVDGDGDLDVVASDSGTTVAWYENTDGLGTFGAEQAITTVVDEDIIPIAVADVDGDGDLDLVTTILDNDDNSTVAWYENTDGLGTFDAEQVILTIADVSISGTVADVDGDGDLDLVTTVLDNDFDSTIAWYENTDGLGTFGAEQVISTVADATISQLVVADVDGDGDVDVIASQDGGTILWHENSANTLNGSSNFIEGGVAVVMDADVVISDVELDSLNAGNGNYAGASVTLVRNGGSSSDDVFSFIDGNGITLSSSTLIKNSQNIASFDTTTVGQLVITFTDANTEIPTSEDVDNILRQITYANNSDDPPESAEIDWTFSDGNTGSQGSGGALNATDTTTTMITAVNDAPVINDLDGDALAYTEGDGAVVIDQGAGAVVSDVDAADFDTSMLTVSFEANSDNDEDVLAIYDQGAGAGNITVSGNTVSYGGTQIGTFTGGSGGVDLVITLNANANDTTTTALVQNITYENTDTDNPTAGSRTVRYVLTDGDGGTSANYDTTVTVTAVNDAPIAADDPGGNFNTVLTNLSPLSYWRLGESSGSTAGDGGSLGNMGTYNGVTLGQAGALSGDADTAAHFNGSSDYVEITHDPNYLLDDGSVQLWFNADSIGSIQSLASKDSTGFDTGGHFDIYVLANGQIEARLQSASASYLVTSSTVVTGGIWHQVAFTFGSNGMALYVDGQLEDTHVYAGGLGATSGDSGNLEPITIGASQRSSGDLMATPLERFFGGLIDEVGIFGSQLTAESIQSLYATGVGAYPVVEDGFLTVSASEGVLSNDADADGDSLTALLVSDVSNGILNLNPDGSFTYTPDANFNGIDSFTYKVNDGTVDGNTATVNITVTAVPDNTVPGPQTVDEDTALPISGLAVNDATGNLSTVELSVTNGTLDVTLSGSATISAGANGSNSLTLAGSQDDINATLASLIYQGTLNYHGADTLTMLSKDSSGTTDSDTVAITVTSVNDTPIATDDPGVFLSTITTQNPLSYWRLGETSGSTGTDLGSSRNDGTYNNVTLGQSGALNGDVNAAGYFDGSTSYVEVPHDASYLLDSGSVQLWFNPDGIGTEQALFSKDSSGFDTGGHLSITVLASGQLHVRLQSTDSNYTLTSADSVTAGSWHHAAFTFGTEGMRLYLDGQVVDTGTYTGGLSTTSGSTGNFEPIVIGGSTARSGNLVANPVDDLFAGFIDEVAIFGTQLNAGTLQEIYAAGLQDYTLVEDGTLTVAASEGVLSNDYDGDGDSLAASLLTGPSHAAAFILNADGAFTYTPVDDFNGSDSFTYQVSDGNGGMDTATATISITAVNDAPVNTVPGAQVVAEDTALNITGLSVNDVDGNLSTVQLGVTHGTVTVMLSGAATISSGDNGTSTLTLSGTQADINATLASLSYQGILNYVGADTLTVTSRDVNSATDVGNVAITVTGGNDAPVIISHGGGANANLSLAENLSRLTTMAATDLNGDPLTYSIVGGADAARFTMDSTTGVLRFVGAPDFENPTDVGSNNVYDVQVQVSDGQGGTDTQLLAITVTDLQEGTVLPPTPDPTPETETEPTPEPTSESETSTSEDFSQKTGSLSPGSGSRGEEGLASPGFDEDINNAGQEEVVNVLDLPPLLRPSSWATTSDQIRSYYPDPLDITKTELSADILQQLNQFSDELGQVMEDQAGERSWFVSSMKGAGLTLTTGFVAWMVRGGALVAGLMTSLPTWRHIDPVPILNMNKEEKKAWATRVKAAAQLEAHQHTGIDQILRGEDQEAISLSAEPSPKSP